MFCPHCGKKIPANSEFCHYCGYKIVKNKQKPIPSKQKATANGKKKVRKKFSDKFKLLTTSQRILFVLAYIIEILLPIIGIAFGSGIVITMTIVSLVLLAYLPYFIEHRHFKDNNSGNKADFFIFCYLAIIFFIYIL